MTDRTSDSYKLGAAMAVLAKAHYLAQAARRAMRDHGGAEKFLDLNAAAYEFQTSYDEFRDVSDGEAADKEKSNG